MVLTQKWAFKVGKKYVVHEEKSPSAVEFALELQTSQNIGTNVMRIAYFLMCLHWVELVMNL